MVPHSRRRILPIHRSAKVLDRPHADDCWHSHALHLPQRPATDGRRASHTAHPHTQLILTIIRSLQITSASSPLSGHPSSSCPRRKILQLTVRGLATTYYPLSSDVRTGWALTLLSHDSLSYASTCQTIGLNTGYFASFTVFLAFNSVDFV